MILARFACADLETGLVPQSSDKTIAIDTAEGEESHTVNLLSPSPGDNIGPNIDHDGIPFRTIYDKIIIRDRLSSDKFFRYVTIGYAIQSAVKIGAFYHLVAFRAFHLVTR